MNTTQRTPLLSGVLAAAVTRGVQHSGRCGVTVKHFACNNQEDNRMGVDVRISQRALREIYLRGFEIAVKTAAPAAIMSSYNRINGVYASNSRDLCTVLAREEWGFDGVHHVGLEHHRPRRWEHPQAMRRRRQRHHHARQPG